MTQGPNKSTTSYPPAKAEAVARELSKMLVDSLSAQMARLFEESGEILLDAASRASNHQESNLYFETMHSLQREKERILASFRRFIVNPPDEKGEVTLDALDLKTDDEVKEAIATSNLEARMRQQDPYRLYELERRLSTLGKAKGGKADVVSITPARIVSAFVASVRGLELDMNVRVEIFRLFEQVVVDRMPNVFEEANRLLDRYGVRPSGHGRMTTPTAPRRAAANKRLAGESFPAGALAGGGLARPPPGVAADAAGYRLDQLDGALMNRFQSMLQVPSTSAGSAASPVGGESPSGAATAPGAILDADRMITAVAAMFASLVNGLPTHGQVGSSLLAPLQAPLLRVAVHDPEFFMRTDHPVRSSANIILQLVAALVNRYGEQADAEAANAGIPELIREFAETLSSVQLDETTPHQDINPEVLDQFLEYQNEIYESQQETRRHRARRLVAFEIRNRVGLEPSPRDGLLAALVTAFGPLLYAEFLEADGTASTHWANLWALMDRAIALVHASAADPDEVQVLSTEVENELERVGEPASRVARLLLLMPLQQAEEVVDARADDEVAPPTSESVAPEAAAVTAEPADTVEPAPVPVVETLEGLLGVVLVPRTLVIVRDSEVGASHYLLVETYRPQMDVVVLRHHLEPHLTRVKGTVLASLIVSGAVQVPAVDDALDAALIKLRALPLEPLPLHLSWTDEIGRPVEHGRR